MRKNQITQACFLAIGPHLALAAHGEIIVYDGFDYPPAVSLEGSGHVGFSWGTNTWRKNYAQSDWLVFSNSLSHSSLPATGNHVAETNVTDGADYERRFSTHILEEGQSVWFSFLVRVTQGASWDLFFTSSGLNASKFGVTASHSDYNISARIGVGVTPSEDEIDLGQNTTRLVVGRYRYSESDVEQLDLWVDPDINTEPQAGGASSSNHIVYTRQHDSEPDRIDSVLLEDRSIGSLEFDELRVGTAWKDVVSRCIDTVSIAGVSAWENALTLMLSRLTPNGTTTVQRTTDLLDAGSWEDAEVFVPQVRATNWVEIVPDETAVFYRVITE